MAEEVQQQSEEEMSDQEAIMKIAAAMKDNAPSQEDKTNVHTFLLNVVQAEEPKKVAKIGNLRDDKEMNELGKPVWNVRGDFGLALISKEIMENDYFTNYFEQDAVITLNTSLSREGFLVRQASTTTKAVADVTKRRKMNRGMFGHKDIETSGGDPYSNQQTEK
jgi:hypothetical protein